MALDLTYNQIRTYLGHQLGYPGTYTTWANHEVEHVDLVMERGLRRFYFQAFIPGAPNAAHDWTFLRDVQQTVSTVADTIAYDLPSDYGQLNGVLTYSTSDNAWHEIQIVNEAQIRSARAGSNDTATGYPYWAAVRPKDSTPTTSAAQTWQLLLWYIPDAAYTITISYSVLPNAIDTTNKYPYGGAYHAETILLACQAAAELDIEGQPGPYEERYLQALASSVSRDGRQMRAESLGYNGDGGGDGVLSRYDFRVSASTITTNGTVYGA